MDEVEIRPIRADEWRELRRLRLEALRTVPLAYGSTYEREAAFTDDDWQRRAVRSGEAGDEITVVATVRDRWIAMARGSASHDDPADAYLTAVYVDAAWRGRGIARGVSARVVDWARERRFARVLLHVADWNDAARRTYASLGFVATGATEPLPHEPTVTELEMALDLG